jgi:hypothetical protein
LKTPDVVVVIGSDFAGLAPTPGAAPIPASDPAVDAAAQAAADCR